MYVMVGRLKVLYGLWWIRREKFPVVAGWVGRNLERKVGRDLGCCRRLG